MIEQDGINALSQEHRDYLLQKHGTLELDPIPDMTDHDPYNWTQSKVRVQACHRSARSTP